MKMSLPASLLLLALATPSFSSAGTLQVIIAPPQRYIDWSTPQSLSASFLKGWLKSHQLNPLTRKKTAMGHGMVHVQCADPDRVEHEFWTGITGNGDTEQKLVLHEKVGVGVLLMDFDNGFIQAEDEVRSTISAYRGRLEKNNQGETTRLKPLFVEFKLTPKECKDAVDFYQAFKNKSFKEPKSIEERKQLPATEKLYFGLSLDPYELYTKNGADGVLGGGCTSYATSFLKVTGHYNKEFDGLFKRQIEVGVKQMGSREHPNGIVSVLLGKKGKSWMNKFSENSILSFYDPEKMYGFMDALQACGQNENAISECSPGMKELLKQYKMQRTELTVDEPYKKKDFENTIQGMRLEKINP